MKIRICPSGKTPFVDVRSAQAVIDEQNTIPLEWRSNKEKVKLPFRIYRCRRCGFYHLTSRPKRRKS